ncbi:Sfl1 protein [Saccharomycopsis crataegensis]|uniref:Heat shock transcription factor n=1 Tax=Saccharomycopsis crataegensis TaxID=43959 RepID=A0AAV5QX47_9ASCO|nr:Sfl1 protein [Saccharomycopsis crataegensis]
MPLVADSCSRDDDTVMVDSRTNGPSDDSLPKISPETNTSNTEYNEEQHKLDKSKKPNRSIVPIVNINSTNTTTSSSSTAATPIATTTTAPSSSSSSKGNHTIFIHKLYNMLEDSKISHLIWWSDTQDSFFLIPGEEFCKVLLLYFKHSNVASFVRQLNMYGFHKVNDNTNNDKQKLKNNSGNDNIVPTAKWEFAHSSENFRKGDLDGLKNIKRRSSKNPNSSSSLRDRNHISEDNLKLLGDRKKINESDEFVYSNDRKSSMNSMNSTGENAKLSMHSHHPVLSFNANNSRYDEVPSLNMKVSELSYNLATIRHEHARLQMQYDSAMEDLKKTNNDMVHLLEIVQKMVNCPKDEISDSRSTASSSDGIKARNRGQYTGFNLESELASFKASIMERNQAKDFTDSHLSSQQHFPPHSSHSFQQTRYGSHDFGSKPYKSQTGPVDQDYHENRLTTENPGTHTATRSESPFSGDSNNHNQAYPFRYIVSHPHSQSPTPYYGPINVPNNIGATASISNHQVLSTSSSSTSLSANTNNITSTTPSNAPTSKHPGQNGVFLHEVVFSPHSSTQAKQRNMSILHDPLVPEPHNRFMVSGMNSPISESRAASGIFSPDNSQRHSRQNGYFSSISSTRTSESAVSYPHPSNGYFTNSGSHTMHYNPNSPGNVHSRSHSLHQNGHHHPLRRDEDSGDIGSSTHDASSTAHGPAGPNPPYNSLKRHSSNDVLFDRSRISSGDSTNSQSTLTFINAPRSVPDLFNPIPGSGKSTSRISFSDRPTLTSPVPTSANSKRGFPSPKEMSTSLSVGGRTSAVSSSTHIPRITSNDNQKFTVYNPLPSISLNIPPKVNSPASSTMQYPPSSSSDVYSLLNREEPEKETSHQSQPHISVPNREAQVESDAKSNEKVDGFDGSDHDDHREAKRMKLASTDSPSKKMKL